MRRFNRESKNWLGEHADFEEQSAPGFRIVLPLRTITPVLGGGVEPWEPDVLDLVRVPAIRGHLRWWWRASCSADLTAKELFEKETAVWGGVTEDDPVRSRVTVRVMDVVSEGIKPAGYHEYQKIDRDGRPNPRLRTPPVWRFGEGLGYALFPLQRSDEERKDWLRHHSGQAMPTKNALTGVSFKLLVDIDHRLGEVQTLEVLQALWLWVNLGGVGARTRRGFGALALADRVLLPQGIPVKVRGLFTVETSDAFCKHVREILAPDVRRPVVSIEAGGRQGTPTAAHNHLVNELQQFRQGRGVGRNHGGQRPGTSHWPEADTLRVKRGAPRYDHAPASASLQDVGSRRQGVPRAAFGLPLGMKFLDDRHHAFDKQADADVYPDEVRISGSNEHGERHHKSHPLRRFASPLLLRPVRVGHDVLPVIVELGGERVNTVRLAWRDKSMTAASAVPVSVDQGAKAPIKAYLGKAKGDAIAAFIAWWRARNNGQNQTRQGGRSNRARNHRNGGRRGWRP